VRSSGFIGLLVLLAGLAGCGGRPGHPPAPGVLTIHFAPHTVAVSGNLTLTSARLQLDHVTAIGDAPPPNNEPPPMGELELDALGPGGDVSFSMLLPGLYSRVRFSFSQVMVTGSWKGQPLTVNLGERMGPMGPQVDLYATGGHELGHGEDVTFTVGVDASAWFAGNVLDGAPTGPNGVMVDDQSMVAMAIVGMITQSFTLQ
jgi:hypothetical protein